MVRAQWGLAGALDCAVVVRWVSVRSRGFRLVDASADARAAETAWGAAGTANEDDSSAAPGPSAWVRAPTSRQHVARLLGEERSGPGTAKLSFFFFQAEDGIRDFHVTGVQTCALPISVRDLMCEQE